MTKLKIAILLLLISLSNNFIIVEKDPAIDPETLILEDFGINQGWINQMIHPRMTADFDGDGLDDIIGFHDTDIYISYCKKSNNY